MKEKPFYEESFALKDLRKLRDSYKLNAAVGGILNYLKRFEPIHPDVNFTRRNFHYSALTPKGSVVVIEGLVGGNPHAPYESAEIRVMNMQKNDKGLIKLLKKIAVESGKIGQ